MRSCASALASISTAVRCWRFFRPNPKCCPTASTIRPSARSIGSTSIYTGYRPLDEPRSAPDAWHERDTLTLVLPDRDGNMLGYLSADAPLDGKVPSIETLRQMQLFTNLVGLALASSRSHAVEIEQRQSLEENARLQNEFFSMVSHEVRSPLAAIRGATALLANALRNARARAAPRVARRACRARPRASRRSSKTSCCSRAWTPASSRCASSRCRRSRSSKNRWRACAANIRSACSMRPTSIRFRTCSPTKGAPCKSSRTCSPTRSSTSYPDEPDPHRRQAAATATCGSRSSTKGRASVRRTGLKLFTRFGRVSSGEGSTGLGLYICRELVGMMRGEIGFESEPEQAQPPSGSPSRGRSA